MIVQGKSIVHAVAFLALLSTVNGLQTCAHGCCYKGSNHTRSFSIPENCRLAIVAAGMPRSGSTWTQHVILKILQMMGLHYMQTYWRYWDHIGMSAEHANALISRTNQLYASLTSDTVMLIKSHEYDPVLLSACKSNVLVFTSYRHPLAVLSSLQHISWYANVTFGSLEADLVHMTKCYTLWSHVAHINAKYEEFQDRLADYAVSLASSIAMRLGVPMDAVLLAKVVSMQLVVGKPINTSNRTRANKQPHASTLNVGFVNTHDSSQIPSTISTAATTSKLFVNDRPSPLNTSSHSSASLGDEPIGVLNSTPSATITSEHSTGTVTPSTTTPHHSTGGAIPMSVHAGEQGWEGDDVLGDVVLSPEVDQLLNDFLFVRGYVRSEAFVADTHIV